MSYTCTSCSLAFADGQGQREHMKSDWHRYNLKRRVAQLPAIDEESFNTKVASMKEQETSESNKGQSKKEERRLRKAELQKQKRDLLETARRSMMKAEGGKTEDQNDNSQQHPSEDSEKEVEPSELTPEQHEEKLIQEKLANQVKIPITTCLFCSPKQKSSFETVDENVDHMFSSHGLYIPERKYLQDLEGLIEYLAEKIGLGNVCLCCSYQGRNLEAVREHMRTKRHMKIPYESENEKLEISEFYDFSSTYDDYVKEGEIPEGEEGDWEDVSGDEDDDDDIPDEQAIYNTGNELILPSGKTLGHRSLAKYYRQNLPPEKILPEGQGTVIAAENRHMLPVKDKQQFNLQQKSWNRALKSRDLNDRRGAKFINQKAHFRDQLLQ